MHLIVKNDNESFVDVVFAIFTSLAKIQRLVKMLLRFLASIFCKLTIECSFEMYSAQKV